MHSARADHNTRVSCTVPAKGAAAAWSNCHPITGAPRTRTYTTRKHTWMNEQGSVHPSLRPVWAARCAGRESDPPSWRASLSASFSAISAPFGLETCDSCSRWTQPAAAVVAAPISPRLGHLGRVGARMVDLNCSCTTTAKEAEEAHAPTLGVRRGRLAHCQLPATVRRQSPMVSTRALGIGECPAWSGTFSLLLVSTFSLEQRQFLDRSNSTDSTQQTTRYNRTHSQQILGPHASALEGGC